jgi:hypothetical protein
MKRSTAVMTLLLALVSCRGYDFNSRLTHEPGLLPPDQFARFGREQAEEMAIAREFGAAIEGSSPEDLARGAAAAARYARTLPDVVDVQTDPLGYRLTIRFKSGWRTMVNPIEDGKRPAETVGLPSGSGARQP